MNAMFGLNSQSVLIEIEMVGHIGLILNCGWNELYVGDEMPKAYLKDLHF